MGGAPCCPCLNHLPSRFAKTLPRPRRPHLPRWQTSDPNRRTFLKRSAVPAAAVTLAAGLDIARSAHAAGSDTVRIALVGCGNRGTGACREALLAAAPVQLVAAGDLFAERIETSLGNLLKYDDLRPKIDVPPERRFTGFDACQKVLAAGVDLVLLATPPHFRPQQYAAAVRAGKHVFMEKPCCIDAPGYRTLVAANAEARQKKLSVVVGLQRRHQRNYLEGIQRIRDGAVGQVRYLRTYFNVPAGGRAGYLRPEGMSEMEYQIRHWGVFLWLCGDHLVEQATHQIDVANWVMDGHPVQAHGHGRPAGPLRVRATATSGTTIASSSSTRATCTTSARPGSRRAPGPTPRNTCTEPRTR